MAFAEPDSAGRLNPKDVVDHLLLVWPIDYIEHSPTKYTKAGQPSDVVVVDAVDLDLQDPMSNEDGYLVRGAWWRQSRLIQATKNRIGTQDPILAWMTHGTASQGMNAPYILTTATGDSKAVARAEKWLAAHPEFQPSQPRSMGQGDSVRRSEPESEPPTQPRTESQLERMARISREGADRLPKLPPDDLSRERFPY